MHFLTLPLGNIGEKYEHTRHNAGRIALKNAFKILPDEIKEKIEVYTPECYMNESGTYLKKYIQSQNKYKNEEEKILPKNIIAIYDDKDIEIGEVKYAFDRGDGGHNGIKSIIDSLSTKAFHRIRVGIAPVGTGKGGVIPPHGSLVQEYVLGRLTKMELEMLGSKGVINKIGDIIKTIINSK